ncbi:HNH endonuclease signature motif containing protein [Methylibium petroleiphilum]
MKTELTAQRLRELLHYDPETGVFTRAIQLSPRAPAGVVVGGISPRGYVQMGVHQAGNHVAHRLAWLYVHGCWPTGEIDHINGVKTDNRIANLRDVSRTVNQQNRVAALRTNRSTGVLGVERKPGNAARPFLVRIRADGKRVRIGSFDTIEAASEAYIKAKRALHEGCTL